MHQTFCMYSFSLTYCWLALRSSVSLQHFIIFFYFPVDVGAQFNCCMNHACSAFPGLCIKCFIRRAKWTLVSKITPRPLTPQALECGCDVCFWLHAHLCHTDTQKECVEKRLIVYSLNVRNTLTQSVNLVSKGRLNCGFLCSSGSTVPGYSPQALTVQPYSLILCCSLLMCVTLGVFSCANYTRNGVEQLSEVISINYLLLSLELITVCSVSASCDMYRYNSQFTRSEKRLLCVRCHHITNQEYI